MKTRFQRLEKMVHWRMCGKRRRKVHHPMAPIPPLSGEEMLMFMQYAPANIFFKDTECRYLFVSDGRTFFPCGEGRKEDVLGKNDLEIWHNEEQARFYYEQDQKVLAAGKGTSYITEVPREDGTAYYQIKKNPVVLEGKIIGIVGLIDDITERVRLEKQMEELSFRDTLTGLYNRTYLEARVKPALKRARLPITVVMADCNYLKKTNDTYGHEYGDLLLKRIARIIRSALPAGCTALRLGGDEFLILCEGCDAQQAEALVENIQSRFAKESDDRIPLSAAFGAHTTWTGEFLFAEAYRCADRAMYENKRKIQAAPPAQPPTQEE